jgi:proton-translocating NADH-quinone oxidoreductase chain L
MKLWAASAMPSKISMYLIPLLATLMSSVFAGALPITARNLGHRGVAVFSIISLVLAFLSSAAIWIDLYLGSSPVWLDLFGAWFEVGTVNVSWVLYYDLLTAHMLFTVTSVSLAVHIYAVVYMRNDPHLSLFMSYLSMFTFFMLVYVCGDNLLVMLVGWEGIGVCSYLLIGYYGHRLAAVKSAQKAILVNRVSDGMLLWGVLWIWYYTGSLEYDIVLLNDTSSISMFIVLSVLVGAMGKSAQILFHVWLADAMEGPTPVSALIHAATLVTAGIYLMVRMGPLMAGSDLVIYIGSTTAFMAGIFGFFQADLKRVIAFSTCSQLGYMMVSVGLGAYGAEASMTHLMTHASFKAALFLAAGVVIMSTNGNQHMARYGGLSVTHSSIFCFLTLLVGCLCLVGFPETSGFYSKEAILNLAYCTYNGGSPAITYYAHTLLYIAALITSCYTAKLFIQSFMYDFSGPGPADTYNHNMKVTSINAPKQTIGVLLIMAMSILILDVLLKIWVGTSLISGIVLFIPWGVKTLPFGLVIAGALSATALFPGSSKQLYVIRFSATRWGFDQLYARSLVNMVLDWGRISWAAGDKGLFIVPSMPLASRGL